MGNILVYYLLQFPKIRPSSEEGCCPLSLCKYTAMIFTQRQNCLPTNFSEHPFC